MGRVKKKASRLKSIPKVNKELEGFEIDVNKFGEIHSNIDIQKINEFLDRNLNDKKLKNRVRQTKKKSTGKRTQ